LTGRSHIVKHAKAILLAICLLVQAKALFAVNKPVYNLSDYFQRDTIPEKKDSIAKSRSAISKYYNLMMKKQSRDSIMRKLSREDKQAAVQMLHERGAFELRRSVEMVAEAMGVSRFTIYNYLNAADA